MSVYLHHRYSERISANQQKKLRIFVKRYLDTKMIGNRIFVNRNELEEILNNPENQKLPIQ